MTYNIAMLSCDQVQLDRRIYQEAETLAKSGYNVSIYTFYPEIILPSLLPKGVLIVKLARNDGKNHGGAINKKSPLFSFVNNLLPSLWKEKLYFYLLNPALSFINNYHISEIEKSDILFAHDTPMLPLAFEIQKNQGFGKIICDLHELFPDQFDIFKTKEARRYWSDIDTHYLNQCDGIITVSDNLAQIIYQRYGLSEKPLVLYNMSDYLPKQIKNHLLHDLYGIPYEKQIFICIGGIDPHRHLQELIESWKIIRPDTYVLVFLGHGDQSFINKLKKSIRTDNLERDIYLGKGVAPDDVLGYAKGASIGFIPYRGEGVNNTEGVPNRLFEYIQARIPILSYDHPGIVSILEKTKTGWTMKWDNAKELSNIIIKGLEERENISDESLEMAAQMYCWENQEDKLVVLVQKVLQ